MSERDPVRPLPSWLWLWTPIAIVVAQVAAKAIGEDFYRSTSADRSR